MEGDRRIPRRWTPNRTTLGAGALAARASAARRTRPRLCENRGTRSLETFWRTADIRPGESSRLAPLAITIDARRLWTAACAPWAWPAPVLAFLIAHDWPGKPSSCRIEHDTLIVLDAQGRECWRKTFPYALMEANFPELAHWTRGSAISMGMAATKFVRPHPLTGSQDSTPLICYDSRGVERWRFANRRRVRTSAEEFAPVFGLARFLVTPRGKGHLERDSGSHHP